MPKRSDDVDAYIASARDFARPILIKLRGLFHKACPQIEETIKWGFPHFEHQGLLGSMAAFKQHVSLGFWKGSVMSDPQGLFKGVGSTSMSALKVSTIEDLPPDKLLLAYIKEAVRLNEQEVKVPRPAKKQAKHPPKVPADLAAALKRNKPAGKTFAAFSPSKRKEYIEWITGAKQQATRDRRLAAAIEWLAEGKSRNWKYENC